jgi:hypothetical protein
MTKQGRDDTQPERQRSLCPSCERRFDDGTDPICAGHHQPLRVWIRCLYGMGLHLSHHHMAHARDLHKDAVPQMPSQVRPGMGRKQPAPTCTDAGECDEVSMVAGHKGKPEAVGQKGGAAGGDAARGNVDAAHEPRRRHRSSGCSSAVARS